MMASNRTVNQVCVIYDAALDHFWTDLLSVPLGLPIPMASHTRQYFEDEDEAIALAEKMWPAEVAGGIRFGIFPKSGEYVYMERERGSKEPMPNGFKMRKG